MPDTGMTIGLIKALGGGVSEAEVEELRSAIAPLEPEASASDVGKFLKAKTVSNGKVTEYEFDTPSVDQEDVTEAVDAWLDENITNPDSPPLDRSLSSSNAAAPADMVGAIDDLLNLSETSIPNPRQLWDKSIIPTLSGNNLIINTSTKAMTTHAKCFCYAIEVNASSGVKYSFNLCNSKTFSEYGVSTIEIYGSDTYPVNGGYALQRGSSSTTYYRGSITLGQNSKYIILNVLADGNSSAEEAKANSDALMGNVVVRAGNNDTTYYDYEAITTYISDAVIYKPKNTLYIGSNIISGSSVSAGTNWTGDYTNGYTHATGAEGDLTITIPNTANVKYLLKMKTSSYAESSLFVVVGDNPRFDTYKGQQDVVVGFVSDSSGTVKISAISGFSTTITNIEICQIKEDGTGTETEIDSKNVYSGNKSVCLTGFWNVAIGSETTQASNVNGSRNVAIGENAQNKLKQGTRNVGIGTYAMPFIKNGERNVAIGSDCLYSTSHVNTDNQAFDNVAIGYAALHDGTMVKQNVAVGVRAMQYAEADSEDNVAIGFGSGNYAHKFNTHIGKRSGYYTKGNYNTGVGWESGSDLYVTGEQNVCVGARAGFDNTGASGENPKTINNSIAVGYNVKATDSNQARFGNSSQTIILAGKKINFNNDGTVTWESI